MRLSHIEIDTNGLPAPTPEVEHERHVAISDLLEENTFNLTMAQAQGIRGPYRLTLGVRDGRLVFDIHTENWDPAAEFHLSLSPFRQVVKDYRQICANYFAGVKNLHPSQLEAIDMARRGIHNEGARVVEDRLNSKAQIDHDTARRLFTLIAFCIPMGDPW